MNEIKIKRDLGPALRTYLIGNIRLEKKEWLEFIAKREKCINMLSSLVDKNGESIYVFDFVKLEELKIGKDVRESKEYLDGLKRSGNWDLFKKETSAIWDGVLFELVDGTPYHVMGDRDYVFHSTFLIMHYTEGDKPIGTIREMTWITDMGKPIYLVTEVNKTTLSPCLLSMIQKPEEHIFQNTNQLKEFLKKEYQLKEKK